MSCYSLCWRIVPVWLACTVAVFWVSAPTFADENENLAGRVGELENLVKSLANRLAEKDEQIDALTQTLTKLQQAQRETASIPEEQSLLDQMTGQLATKKSTPTSSQPSSGAPAVRLADISAILSVAAGVSDMRNSDLENLQGGGHDPKRRGFNLQQLELSLAGSVDPWFDLESHIVFSEEAVELEEAFATTRALPADLQLKVGYFLTEFGRVNSQHPHSWDWLDQPIVNTRMFGGEGMRGAGIRASWLAPVPWYSEFMVSMQDATGEFMASFNGEGLSHSHGDGHDEEEAETIGGRPIVDSDMRSGSDMVYMMRMANGFNLTDSLSGSWGVSGLFGPNNTGSDAQTRIFGTDLTLKYDPAGSGLNRPRLTWQTEMIKREYEAAEVEILDDMNLPVTLPADTLDDWGLYSQILHTLNRDWSWGVRYEYATGGGNSYEHDELVNHDDDPLRDTRWRVSPLVIYHPSEFTRLRLQYNYDDASHLASGQAHSLWLGFEFLIGSHPSHKY